VRVGPTIVAAIQMFVAAAAIEEGASAQSELRRVAAKNGESIDLHSVFWVSSCRSIMIGLPEIEMLEGPAQATLSIREEPVLPRRFNCAAKIPGGTLVLSIKGVTEKTEAKLTYRLKYKTRDGDRQTSQAYIVSMFP
jgi:hypothetical protein